MFCFTATLAQFCQLVKHWPGVLRTVAPLFPSLPLGSCTRRFFYIRRPDLSVFGYRCVQAVPPRMDGGSPNVQYMFIQSNCTSLLTLSLYSTKYCIYIYSLLFSFYCAQVIAKFPTFLSTGSSSTKLLRPINNPTRPTGNSTVSLKNFNFLFLYWTRSNVIELNGRHFVFRSVCSLFFFIETISCP